KKNHGGHVAHGEKKVKNHRSAWFIPVRPVSPVVFPMALRRQGLVEEPLPTEGGAQTHAALQIPSQGENHACPDYDRYLLSLPRLYCLRATANRDAGLATNFHAITDGSGSRP